MRLRHASLALGISVLLGACAGAQKPKQINVAQLECQGISDDAVSQIYAPQNLKRVEPLHRKEFRARAVQAVFVSGAALHVPAQPGMSAAYVERALSCHAAGAAISGRPDPLRVAGVEQIRVRESGPMLRIAITSNNIGAARRIVQQAEALKASDTEVSVEQLSAAPTGHRAF